MLRYVVLINLFLQSVVDLLFGTKLNKITDHFFYKIIHLVNWLNNKGEFNLLSVETLSSNAPLLDEIRLSSQSKRLVCLLLRFTFINFPTCTLLFWDVSHPGISRIYIHANFISFIRYSLPFSTFITRSRSGNHPWSSNDRSLPIPSCHTQFLLPLSWPWLRDHIWTASSIKPTALISSSCWL